MPKKLVLASSSPRRRQLLEQLGVEFEVFSADIDESVQPLENPEDYVSRLALQKCQKVFELLQQDAVVIGSDTSVIVDQKILGKPEDEEDALSMLMALSGRWHQVMTAVAIKDQHTTRKILVTTNVEFCELTEQMCRTYWQTGEPFDKAGSYGIQGIGGSFVKQINGSYTAVVGFPLAQVAQLLRAFEVEIFQFVKAGQ